MVVISVAVLFGQAWPTYNGDYSGRRYSSLAQINASNVSSLSLAWVHRANTGGGAGNAQAGGGGNAAAVIKGTPIEMSGVLYFTAPDHVWAVDAHNGRELWHYEWKSKGGWHIGNRGAGVWGEYLYFETPDCNLVSLDLKDGKERWHKEICDLEHSSTYGSVAPVVVKNHVIVGVSGDDLDIPGYYRGRTTRKPASLQWRWYAHPESRRIQRRKHAGCPALRRCCTVAE